MDLKDKQGFLFGKPWVKIVVIAVVLLAALCGLLFLNELWGNPIRKWMAKSTCRGYFEERYQQAFTIHEIEYWSKLPGYVLILSPEDDPGIRFYCNPNCEPICYSDEYGGALASGLLIEQIEAIVEPEYAHLGLQITAAEDPFTSFEGEAQDFFVRDPLVRLAKNHQEVNIIWVDPSIRAGAFEQIAAGLAEMIEAHLPVINPNLQLTIAVYADESQWAPRYTANFHLFQTMVIEE